MKKAAGAEAPRPYHPGSKTELDARSVARDPVDLGGNDADICELARGKALQLADGFAVPAPLAKTTVQGVDRTRHFLLRRKITTAI